MVADERSDDEDDGGKEEDDHNGDRGKDRKPDMPSFSAMSNDEKKEKKSITANRANQEDPTAVPWNGNPISSGAHVPDEPEAQPRRRKA